MSLNFKHSLHFHSRFTVVELLIVSGLVLILSAILTPHVIKAIDSSKTVKCQSNINQLSIAIKFYIEQNSYPPKGLNKELKNLISSSSVFNCPADQESYENFYIARNTRETEAYVIGCPKHSGLEVYKNLMNNSNQVLVAGTVKYDGEIIEPGQIVSGGVLTFEDGSHVTSEGGKPVGVIGSYKVNGKLHSVIRVYQACIPQNITINVKKGSHFTVKTPSAVAGVRGTKFKISTRWGPDKQSIETQIKCFEGTVYLENQSTGSSVDVEAGEETMDDIELELAQRDPESKILDQFAVEDVEESPDPEEEPRPKHSHSHRHGRDEHNHEHILYTGHH